MSKSDEEKFVEFYEEKLRLENTRQITNKWVNRFKNFGKKLGIDFEKHDKYSRYPNYFSFSLDDEDLKVLYEKYKPVAERKKCELIEKNLKIIEENIKYQQGKKERLLKEKCT